MNKIETIVCPGCGGSFQTYKFEGRKFCCKACANKVLGYKRKHGGTLDGFVQTVAKGSAKFLELHDPKKLDAARMAKRDAEYAKFAAENVPVTIEERDKRVVENRGRVPAGCCSR